VHSNVLADTGALLACLDRSDPWHERCRRTLEQLRLPLHSSTAVLTELFHLIGDDKKDLDTAWTFIRSGAVQLLSITTSDLPDLEALMAKYHDRPMDFADATLVHLAHRESLTTVFTVDHNDFETYRIGGRKRFRIVPAK
jgi:predicted nucleic acid-binding protein